MSSAVVLPGARAGALCLAAACSGRVRVRGSSQGKVRGQVKRFAFLQPTGRRQVSEHLRLAELRLVRDLLLALLLPRALLRRTRRAQPRLPLLCRVGRRSALQLQLLLALGAGVGVGVGVRLRLGLG